MKNKKNIILSVFLGALIFISSCSKDWLDVNVDPNNPKTANPELVLPAAEMSLGTVVGYYYNLVGGFWSQYWSQSNAANQYKYIDQYQIQDNSTPNNRAWREAYANGLSDLQYVINTTKEKKNWSIYLMATVMQGYGWQVMVDFMSNVPYSEAFQGDASNPNFNPHFDDGKTIYLDVLSRIDTALLKTYNELSDAEKKGDFLYKGDIASWIKFANTLKLKMYMRMMYADPTAAEAGVKSLYDNGAEFITTPDEEAKLDVFIDQEGKDNPLYANDRRKLNVATNLRVSATLYRYLQAKSDPRLDAYVQANSNPMPQGGFNIPTPQLAPTSVAIFRITATDPVYFISAVESNLLQAEAVAMGWGTGDAKALYDEAVTLSFDRYGEDATSFLDAGGAYEYPSAGTFEVQQKAIMMAKWAALAGTQGLEMFFETNRTGYPVVSAIPAWENGIYNTSYEGGELTYSLEGITGGIFPASFIYPQEEVNLNKNFPGQRTVTAKVWWDVK